MRAEPCVTVYREAPKKMKDLEETFRQEDDEAFLEAYRNIDETRFTQHADAIAIAKDVPVDEVKQRAEFLVIPRKKLFDGSKRKSPEPRASDVDMPVIPRKKLKETEKNRERSSPRHKTKKTVAKSSLLTVSDSFTTKIPRKKAKEQMASPGKVPDSNKPPLDNKSSTEGKMEEAERGPATSASGTNKRNSMEEKAKVAERNSGKMEAKRVTATSGPGANELSIMEKKAKLVRKKSSEQKKESKGGQTTDDSGANKPSIEEKKAKLARRKSSKSPSGNSDELNDLEVEFAWLVEESFLSQENPSKRLAFWFVELHASNELKKWIDYKKQKLSYWNRISKIQAMIQKCKMDKFKELREKVRRDLMNGKRRKQTEDHLPVPGTKQKCGDDGSNKRRESEYAPVRDQPRAKMDIKPRHNVGDKVFACWLHDKGEESNYFPATVRGFQVDETDGPYGEGRLYDILFDDGDEDRCLEDIFVKSRKDYNLIMEYDLPKKGVKTNKGKGDRYAEEIGWFTTKYTGKKTFAFLSDAVKAHDEAVVNMKGKLATKTDLLYPKDWKFFSPPQTKPPVFAEAPLDGDLSEDSDFYDVDDDEMTLTPSPPTKKSKVIDTGRSRLKQKASSNASTTRLMDTPEEMKESECANFKVRKRWNNKLADKFASKKKTKRRRTELKSFAEDEDTESEEDENGGLADKSAKKKKAIHKLIEDESFTKDEHVRIEADGTSGRAEKSAARKKTEDRVIEDDSVVEDKDMENEADKIGGLADKSGLGDEHMENEADENLLRFDLAVAHRLTAKFGMDMLAWNGISARFGSGCLMSTGRRMGSVFKPDDIAFVSANDMTDVIHEAIYKARPDVKAIVHLQSPAATAVSCLQDGFQFLTLDSAYFYKKLATYDVNRTTDDELRDIVAAVSSVKGCNTLLMHNHGFVSFGASVREAWVLAWNFERCCEIQLNVMKTGGAVRILSEEVMAEAAESGSDPEFAPGNEWDSLTELVSFD